MSWSGKKGGGGDVVLESRHLVGLFLLTVVISGVVFTLGYVLGRSQYDTQIRAAIASSKEPARPATAPPAAEPAAPTGLPASSDWNFYHSGEPKKPEDQLEKLGKATTAARKRSSVTSAAAQPASTKTRSLLNAPLVPRGAIMLQVAALTREGDALALAEALQKKKFPAFVLTPSADQYYRVQVGPYADMQSANIAKRGLENEGFKAIIKR